MSPELPPSPDGPGPTAHPHPGEPPSARPPATPAADPPAASGPPPWPAVSTWDGPRSAGYPPPQQPAPAYQQPLGYQQHAGHQQPVGYQQHPATGAYGYAYGAPMPTYPAPQFPPPVRRPQPRVPAWLWVIAATLVVAVVTVFAVPVVVGRGAASEQGQDGTSADPPDDGFGQPNTSSSGTFVGEHMVRGMNEALTAQDADAFFRFVDGDAREPLRLWWDNMDVLGWSTGAFSVAPGQPDAYAGDEIRLIVTLGAVTAGSPQIPADSPHPDAGLSYAPSNVYAATVRVTDDGASGVLTGWEVQDTAAPWDLEPLYAVVEDGALTAGYADEEALVDRTAALAGESASWVVRTWEDETGVANAQRFTTFVTENRGRFNDWFIGETTGWTADRAGTMFPQRRPYDAPGIDPTIATGGLATNSGGILTVGPNGLLYGPEDTQDTIAHEFVHAIHTTNVPETAWPGSTVMEGWAAYNESLFRGDGAFAAPQTYYARVITSCLEPASFTGEFPVQSDFTDVDTAHCAYALSATMYAYADSVGVDVYAVADEALATGDSLPEVAADAGGPEIDEAGWVQWLDRTF